MNSLADVNINLTPIIAATLDCAEHNPQLYPLKDAFRNLQLGFFWIHSADKQLNQESGEDSIVHQERPMAIRPPSMISNEDRFAFIKDRILALNSDIQNYTSEVSLPPEIKYKINRGYDNFTEAYFNVDIALEYYNQLTNEKRKK